MEHLRIFASLPLATRGHLLMAMVSSFALSPARIHATEGIQLCAPRTRARQPTRTRAHTRARPHARAPTHTRARLIWAITPTLASPGPTPPTSQTPFRPPAPPRASPPLPAAAPARARPTSRRQRQAASSLPRRAPSRPPPCQEPRRRAPSVARRASGAGAVLCPRGRPAGGRADS